MSRIGAIILAAGESKRLGQPKQLVRFRGKTLIEHACHTATAVCSQVAVVLGANADLVRPSVPAGAILVENPLWAEGMASSIRAGLSAIQSDIDLVVIMSCDQPLVTPDLLRRLLSKFGATAAQYNGTLGIPAMFSAIFFPALLALKGVEGARKILAKSDLVTAFPAPEAAFDVDTPEDLERLRSLE